MFSLPFFYRVYFSYVLIIFITSISIGLVISEDVERDTQQQIDDSLRKQASLLAEVARAHLLKPTEQDADITQVVKQLGQSINSRLTVISSRGTVLADSEREPGQMDNHSDRPELIMSLDNNFGSATRFSETIRQQMRYIAVALNHQQQHIGFVRAALSLSAIDDKVNEVQNSVFKSLFIPLVLALVIGFWFARNFTKPIYQIIEGTSAFAEGDYQHRIAYREPNELGKMAKAINKMAQVSTDRFEQLTADKQKLATILSGMAEGVIAVDEDQRVIHINEAAAKIFQVSAAASVGVSVWQIIRIKEITRILREVLSEQDIIQERIQIAGKEQDLVFEVYCASLTATSSENAQTKSEGAIIVLHDLTELHRLERVRQDFVANASHELKTPITAIRGFVETILDDPEMPREIIYDFINKSNIQTERLSSLISDLMTISRIENSAEIEKQIIDLNQLLLKVHQSFEPIAREKNIHLTFSESKEPAKVYADQQSLLQVFDNLVDNAIKYTPENGQVAILCELQAPLIVISVKDDGIGIKKEDQGRIFERFYRVDKARSKYLGSTGLGLSIVKHLVEQHQGAIYIESDYGQGTRFVVELLSAN